MAKSKKCPPNLDPRLPIYQLKITLQLIDPPIWRVIETNDCTLDDLHAIIQAAMGWEESHPHAFDIRGKQYVHPEMRDSDEGDTCALWLSDLVERKCLTFDYEYDLGDSWQHTIEILQTMPAAENLRYPRCLTGERACPPEDCGGPWGYNNLLDAFADPDRSDSEYDDRMEFLLDELDPEEFDVAAANRELQAIRKFLGGEPGKYSATARFSEGDLVCVKPQVVHPQYSDIPLGGWRGEVETVTWLTPLGYRIRWCEETLDQIHPVYFKRCQRDREDPAFTWLDEVQLDPSPATAPPMEQPVSIVTRPLSADDVEDRVRGVFGLTSDDPLPLADENTLQTYLAYLQQHVHFPLQATCMSAGEEMGKLAEVTVLGFASPALVDTEQGLLCDVQQGTQRFTIELSTLWLAEDDPHSLQLTDYTFWLWDVQDLAEDDEDEDDLGYGEYDPDDDEFAEDDFDDDAGDLDDEDFEDDDFEEGGFDKATDLASLLHRRPGRVQYPVGTMALYGPDNKRTTKIAAGVLLREGAEPLMKRWMGSTVMQDAKVQREIAEFFQHHGVRSVVATDGNIGCPHEEGEDFPEGGDCPFCPYWKGKQGSGRTDR